MKTLILVRHGRAEPQQPGKTDFERALDHRGLREVTEMARGMARHDARPDCILASPARRTRQSAAIFARELDFPEERVQLEERLYLAPPEQLLAVLRALGPTVRHALLVGHNPGLSELLHRLAPAAPAGDLATGALARLSLAAPLWGELGRRPATEVACEAPKRH